MSLLFAAAAARTRITATMRSLTALSSSQAAQAAALTTTTATTPSVRMPAAFPSRSAFKRLDSHLKRSKAMFRHHPTSFSSHRAVSAAAAGAEAMASSSSAAAAGGGDIDFVGSQLPQEEDEEEELPESFKEFDLDDRVTTRLPSLGIHAPTPIQARAIDLILDHRDVALRAPTGSGKTLAFLLPVLSEAIRQAELEAEAAIKQGKQPRPPSVHAVVVSPSRELAMQTVRVAQKLLPQEAASAVVQQAIGGANPHRQAEALKMNRPLLVVGTPGRLAELSRSGALQTHTTSFLVLDEADQLLAPQFREELTRLMEQTGKKCERGRTTVLVSATMTPRVVDAYARWTTRELTTKPLEAPKMVPTLAEAAAAVAAGLPIPDVAVVSVGPSGETSSSSSSRPPPLLVTTDPLVSSPKKGPSAPISSSNANANKLKPEWGWGVSTSDGVRVLGATSSSAGGVGSGEMMPTLPATLDHAWIRADRRLRTDALRKTVHALGASRALVFMNAGKRLKDTQFKLAARGMPCACLHGDLGKQAREAALADFAAGRARVLLVSDVAARGLDLPGVDTVINLELPSDAAHYAHRAGRAGRAGASGVVVSLVEPSEEFVMERLGKKLGVRIPMAQLAAGRVEVVERGSGEEEGEGGEENGGNERRRSSGGNRPSVRVLGSPPAAGG